MNRIFKTCSVVAMATILSLGASAGSKAFASSVGGTNEVTRGFGTGYIQEFNNMTSSATWVYSMGTCWANPSEFGWMSISIQNVSSTNVQATLYLEDYLPWFDQWEAVAHTGVMTNNGNYHEYYFDHDYNGVELNRNREYRFHLVLPSGAATTTSYLYQKY